MTLAPTVPTTEELETWPVQEDPPQPGTVAFEAARLDRLFPGWYTHIDTRTLDLFKADRCVLGQGCPDLGYMDARHTVMRDELQNGLCLCGAYACNDPYRRDWIVEINKRKNN
jgi:hypothetical protein